MYIETPTEKQILTAAAELFLEKGYRATSTTAIAKRAGCNQALIYYYFRSKENLFGKVFSSKTEQIFSKIAEPFSEKQDIFSTIRAIIAAYFDFLRQNERLAFFLVNELVINEENRPMIISEFEKNISHVGVFLQFDQLVRESVKNGLIRPIETFDIMLNIISLCVSTFLAKPILTSVLGITDEASANYYYEHRKEEIMELVVRGSRLNGK